MYDLVILKEALKREFDTELSIQELTRLRNRIANIKFQVKVLDPEYEQSIDQWVAYYDNLISKINPPISESQTRINEINDRITELSHKLFDDSFKIENSQVNVDFVRDNRKIPLREDMEQIVKQRILLYTNWRYPALEIGCRDGEWTQYLVAADPLYITDPFIEFLDKANSQFPGAYQNRLRKYQLKDYNFSALPKNQFAFVFSWGHFNFLSLDTTGQVLKQLRELMRPGGVFLFSYNDGDTPQGAGMAETMAQTYLPKSLLIPTCESLGFEIVNDANYGPNVTWLEIKKPGTLSTIKAHQVLGEIKRIQN